MKQEKKQKILIFIAGIIVGVVLTTGCFLIFRKDKHPNMPRQMNQEQREFFKQYGPMNDRPNRPDRKNQDNNKEQDEKKDLPSNDSKEQNKKS